jgi:hypothetical protein
MPEKTTRIRISAESLRFFRGTLTANPQEKDLLNCHTRREAEPESHGSRLVEAAGLPLKV